MTTTPPAPAPAGAPPPQDATSTTRGQIRGSSLLLSGRLLSMVANLAVQVLIVRHLSRGDYGAFAYALSLVMVVETIITFGLDRAVTRFVAVYDEQGRRPEALGTLVMVVGVVVSLGAVAATLVWLGGQPLLDLIVDDPQAATLLATLILLAPIQALDALAIAVFAVFAKPGAIFVRRYVMAPLLRLSVVVALVTTGSGVGFLAGGYVIASALGLVVYLPVLVRVLRDRGMLARSVRRELRVPVREVLSFTIPLLTSDLVYIVVHTADVVMLGYFQDTTAVGALKAVQPVAKLNLFVMSSFALLYTPVAARLRARADQDGLDELYWRTAAWLAVLSFPVFLAGTAMARPLTVTLFGSDYAGSAALLVALSVGTYVQVAFGFNGLTLKAIGAVRAIVVLNVAAAVANVALNLLLIPRFGALGAAWGTAGTLVVHNVLKQIALHRVTRISLLRRDTVPVYLAIAGAVVALGVLQVTTDLALIPGLAIGAVLTAAVLRFGAPMLDVPGTFPELRRVPWVFRLLGVEPPQASEEETTPST